MYKRQHLYVGLAQEGRRRCILFIYEKDRMGYNVAIRMGTHLQKKGYIAMKDRTKKALLVGLVLLCLCLTACGGNGSQGGQNGQGGSGANGGQQAVTFCQAIPGADFSQIVEDSLFFVYLQVNPEFRVYLDGDFNVTCIEAINEDAKALFGSHYSVFEGPYESFLETFTRVAAEQGYLKEGAKFQGDMIGQDGETVPEDGPRLMEMTETALKNFSDSKNLGITFQFGCGMGDVNPHDSVDMADTGSAYVGAGGSGQNGNNGNGGQGSGSNNGSGQGGSSSEDMDKNSAAYAALLQKAESMIMGNIKSFEADRDGNIVLIVEEDSAGTRIEHRFEPDGTLIGSTTTHLNGKPVDESNGGQGGNQGSGGQQTGDAGNQGSGNGGQGSGDNSSSGNQGSGGSGGNEGWGAGGSSSSTTPSGPPQGNPIKSEVLSKHANGVPAVERETWADGAYRETTRYDNGCYDTITEVWADGWTYTWVYYTPDEGGRVKTYGWYDPHNNVTVQMNYTADGSYAEGYRGKNKWYQWYNENGICIKDVYDQGFLYTEIYFDPNTGEETERYETNHNTGGSFHEYYTADRKYRITEHYNSSGKLWEKVTCNLVTGEVTSELF